MAKRFNKNRYNQFWWAPRLKQQSLRINIYLSTLKDFTFAKFISQLFSKADESFKDEVRLLLLCVGSLVTLYTFVFTHIASVVGPVHTFKEGSRVSKGRLKGELCFHCYVHFLVFPYIVSVFATSSVLAIRRTSLLRNFHLGCSAALMGPLGVVGVCRCL